ncbi:MAG: carbamoyltransferase C-terminal domain-containing protein [Patescibacteria group bacterium]|nr:carbamoyltransferase C-terminal domain-containing protein [Patescibacteria group bacterium]
MDILGLHLDTHDSGAAIVRDGKILAAANEERFSRIKMDGAPPRLALASVLATSGIAPKDLNVIAISGLRPGFRKYWYHFLQQAQRVTFTHGRYLQSFYTFKSLDRGRFFRQTGLYAVVEAARAVRAAAAMVADLRRQGFSGEVTFVDHDLAHAAGAYYTSGFARCFVAIIEGSSFTNTCSFWRGHDGQLTKVGEVPLPHSPGRYYEVVTRILNFHPKKHGGKITGLAAFGDPKKLYPVVERLFWAEGKTMKVSPELFSINEEYFTRGKSLPAAFAGYAREDIAAAFQRRLEDVCVQVISAWKKELPFESLALSGGVVANVKLNFELLRQLQLKEIFVHPGMGDAGQALGAALAVMAQRSKLLPFKMPHAYLGPSFDERACAAALTAAQIPFRREEDVARWTAQRLAENKVVGFFQGRMEYGPRALGNRSILYPATDPKVNDWLNKRLKRSEFMPFAPVTLDERAQDCYDLVPRCRHTAKFMTITLPATRFMREKMPAAVHIDGTCRPQLIDRQTNPVYYDTLKRYEEITGLPTLVNTSFNMHEEPIVCTPQEAISAYLQSELDVLVLGNLVVERRAP